MTGLRYVVSPLYRCVVKKSSEVKYNYRRSGLNKVVQFFCPTVYIVNLSTRLWFCLNENLSFFTGFATTATRTTLPSNRRRGTTTQMYKYKSQGTSLILAQVIRFKGSCIEAGQVTGLSPAVRFLSHPDTPVPAPESFTIQRVHSSTIPTGVLMTDGVESSIRYETKIG